MITLRLRLRLTEETMKQMTAMLVLALVSTGAIAQADAPPARGGAQAGHIVQQLQTRFANANTTQDGKLTRDQAAAGMPRVAQHFDEIDTQHAGFVTLPQIEDFMHKKAMARQ